MSRLSKDNDKTEGDEAVEPHSELAVQAARAATILVTIAFLMPRVTRSPRMVENVEQLILFGRVDEGLIKVLPYLVIPLALSSAVGTIVSLVQSRLKNRWWAEIRLGYHREPLPRMGAMFLLGGGGIGIGLWSLVYWAGVVNGCLGIGGDVRDLLVAVRGWLLSLGGGCAFVSMATLVLVHRPWEKEKRDSE